MIFFFGGGIGAEWMQLLNLISSAQWPTVTFRVATKTLHKLFTIVIFTYFAKSCWFNKIKLITYFLKGFYWSYSGAAERPMATSCGQSLYIYEASSRNLKINYCWLSEHGDILVEQNGTAEYENKKQNNNNKLYLKTNEGVETVG